MHYPLASEGKDDYGVFGIGLVKILENSTLQEPLALSQTFRVFWGTPGILNQTLPQKPSKFEEKANLLLEIWELR